MRFRESLTEGSLAQGLALVLCLLLGLPAVTQAVEPGYDVDLNQARVQSADGMGFVPPAFPTEHIAADVAQNLRADKALPAAYDTRTLGYVTPVRNQGSCGSCYAFGSAADLESRVLMAGLPEVDLSENDIKECNYLNTSCDGGNQYITMSYMADAGVTAELCDPYAQTRTGCNRAGCAGEYTVLQWSAIAGGSVPATDLLKQYILDHGPVHTTLYAGDGDAWAAEFAAYDGTGALHYEGTETPNHSVFLVGWDDAVGAGAWIVKNSWGTSWGGNCGFGPENGYFYIDYGSANIGMYSSFVSEFMGTNVDASLLRLDEAGYTSAYGASSTTFWGMAKLVNSGDTYLHRVEFWTSDVTTDVDVYVYDNFDGSSLSGLLCQSLDNAYAEPGYHSVSWGAPISLTPDQDIYVAVKFTNVSYTYPLCVDVDGPKDADCSWFGFNGSTWYNLAGADVTISARVSTATVLGIDDTHGDPELPPVELPTRLTIDSVRPNPFNPMTTVKFSLPEAGFVNAAIYDLQGRLVQTLLAETRDAGSHEVVWRGETRDGQAAPAGVYFCIVESGDQVRATKLALLK